MWPKCLRYSNFIYTYLLFADLVLMVRKAWICRSFREECDEDWLASTCRRRGFRSNIKSHTKRPSQLSRWWAADHARASWISAFPASLREFLKKYILATFVLFRSYLDFCVFSQRFSASSQDFWEDIGPSKQTWQDLPRERLWGQLVPCAIQGGQGAQVAFSGPLGPIYTPLLWFFKTLAIWRVLTGDS